MRDGHIHSPFCPHGTKDSLNSYIEKAIALGYTDISFTEHAPLPQGFTDTTPQQDSGMAEKDLYPYLEAIEQAKIIYQKDLIVRVGLEVDFISGFEKETRSFLDEVGPYLDDSILSVHFLQWKRQYFCSDISQDVFFELVQRTCSINAVYDLYYDTLEASIRADLGAYKPKRIGHPTLIHKFQHAHGETIDDSDNILRILHLIAKSGYELDLNAAGFSKPDCLESYPPQKYIAAAVELGIPLVYGSDAHSADGLHIHHSKLYNE